MIIIMHTAAFPQSGSSSAGVHPIQDRLPTLGIFFPTLFEKCCGFFKVPCIGLVEVGRLGQRLNIPYSFLEVLWVL